MNSSPGKFPLHWQILAAIVGGAVAGRLSGVDGMLGPLHPYALYAFLGTLFLNALKMLIVPLVTSSLIIGIGGMERGENLGRIGAKTLGYYLLSSLLAILLGLAVINAVRPGIIGGVPAGKVLHLDIGDPQVSAALQHVQSHSAGDFTRIFLDMVPPNIFAAAAEGQMLGLITFSLLFGFFMVRVGERQAQLQRDFWQGVSDVMMAITMLVMRFAPIGVFGLVAKTVAATGFAAIAPLAAFFFAVLIALAGHTLIVLPLLLRLLGRVKPYGHLRSMAPALLTAFSTASSSATLPVNMECLEKNVGVSNRITGFVLPLGATVNMDGTALYECAAALFIAQAYGLDLSFGQQFSVVLVALLTSIGVAGIPAASLVAIGVILGAIGLPLEGIGLLLVTDRVLDMVRTAVNVFSDSCGAVIIARSEGETTVIDR